MAITLADAALNTTDDLDLMVIDEFRKSSHLLDTLEFDQCVSPVGGGATLSYTYTRLITERSAGSRKQNSEYAKSEAKRQRRSVDLIPLGGAYQVDRVLANLGPATTNEVAFQTRELIKSTVAAFHDEFVNGTAVDFAGGTDGSGTPGFDGLKAITAGTSTEKAGTVDWSGIGDDRGKANDALDELDEWLGTMDGLPSVLITSDKGAARLRSLARRAGYYERSRDGFGREVESYRGIPFINLGEKPGSSNPIVGVTAATSSKPGTTDIYAVRYGLNSVHAVTVPGPLVQTWLPDFSTSGAVKPGEVEMGPVAVVAKRTKGVAAFKAIIAPKTS